LENKVNQTEFNSEISNLSLKFDEFNKEIQKKTSNFATIKELNQLNSSLENKANLNDVNEALNTKANKESVINALHRKANKNEIELILKNKIEIEEIQNIINLINNKPDYIELEKIANLIHQKTDRDEILNIKNLLNSKLESREFEIFKNIFNEYKNEKNKKIEEIDHDIDRLIENIKKEFGNMNIILNNFEIKKCDLKNFENLNSQIFKKCDEEFLNDSLNILKKNFIEMLDEIKNESEEFKKKIREEIYDKIYFFEKNMERTNEDNVRNREKISDLFEQRKNDQDEMIKLTKNVLSNTQRDIMGDINLSRSELQKCISDIQELFSKKIDKKEFEFFKEKFTDSLNLKVIYKFIFLFNFFMSYLIFII
jgi:hypothetical protein